MLSVNYVNLSRRKSMKSPNTKSSNELEKDVRDQIHKVNRDIDDLQGRLTPGQMIDDAIFSRHNQSLRSTFDHLKQNPIGTTFLSLGTLMLMQDDSTQSYELLAKNKFISMKESMRTEERVGNLKEKVTQMKGDMKSKLESKVETLRSKAKTSTSDLENWRSSEDDLGIKQKTKDALSNAKSKLTSGYESGSQKIKSLDPMTFAAIGAGLGSLTGASLPLNEKEKEFVDGHFKDRLGDFDKDLRNAINECSNILKDLVVSDVKDYTFKIV